MIEWQHPNRCQTPTIEDAKALLRSICARCQADHADAEDSVGAKHSHALQVLSWVERFDPNASLPLQLGALFHNIDSVAGSDASAQQPHGVRSSRLITPVLAEMGFPDSVVARTAVLICHHDDTAENVETAADAELYQLVAASAFAILSTSARQFLAAGVADKARKVIQLLIDRLPEPARAELWEHRLEDAELEGLKKDCLRDYYRKHSPRERPYKYCPTCRTALERKVTDGISLLACGACGFILWNPPVPVTSVIIEKGSSVLLVRRAARPLQGYWCLPGGFIGYLETPEAAAIREVKEETGLDVQIDQFVGIFQIDNAPGGVSLDIVWKGSAVGGTLGINDESTEAAYFDRAALPDLIAYKHRQAIDKS